MEDLIGSPDALLRMIIIGVISYLLLILMLRVMGKRTLSKMNAFDFVITVALGSTFATVILDSSIPMIDGVMALGLLVLLQYIITFASVRSKAIGRIIKSEPTLLFYNGEFIEKNMIKERTLKVELDQAVRKAGHSSYESISAVILETDGALSVIENEGTLVHDLDKILDTPLDR